MKKTYSKPSIHITTMAMENLLAGSYHGEGRSKGAFDDMFGSGGQASKNGSAIQLNNVWDDNVGEANGVWTEQ